MSRLFCLLIGYCFGMIQCSFLFGKAKGVDLRKHGSGNLGTTNTLRTLGNASGAIVLVLDALKAAVAILVTWLIFGKEAGYYPLLILYTGFGAVLGHDYPFYLKFKGGKGVACTVGLAICLDIRLVPIPLLTFILIVIFTHYVSLGSLMAYLMLFLNYVAMGQLGLITNDKPVLYESYILLFVMMLLAYWQHFANIRRLTNHEERKTFLKKKKREENNE